MGGVRGDYRSLLPADAAASAGPFRGFGRGRQIDVEQLWKFVRLHDYVAGDFMWTGIDHLGEARWPNKGSSSGVIDTCGFPKDGYYFYQSQWTTKPMLHLFPHWNWKGKEGQFVPVTCYTNCDTVELFINGRSAGVRGYAFPRVGMEGTYGNYPPRARAARTTADLHLSWDIPYEPGTLKAVGTKDGKVVETVEVTTTGDPATIVLSADKGDVIHVTARIVDAQGRMVPTADNEIVVELSGPVRLFGMDAGNPASHEDYRSSRRKAFNGLCLALLKRTGAGEIRVIVASQDLQPARLQFA
jgi:beta-galactosidase